jgi:hypothetical protein
MTTDQGHQPSVIKILAGRGLFPSFGSIVCIFTLIDGRIGYNRCILFRRMFSHRLNTIPDGIDLVLTNEVVRGIELRTVAGFNGMTVMKIAVLCNMDVTSAENYST